MAVKKKTTKKKTKNTKPVVKPEVNKKAIVISIAVCLVVSLIISVVALAMSKKSEQLPAVYDFNKSVADGVDISEHNGKIDFKALKKDVDFVFIRVGYRGYANAKLVEDKYAKTNIKQCEKAGIPYGVYIYSQAITEKEAKKEADFAINMIKHHSPSLPIIIDFEYACDKDGNLAGRLYESGLSVDEKTDIINAFCDRVRDKGYVGGVYASSSVLANEINTKKLDKNTFIWVADYNSSVTYDVPYTVWQYSKTGKNKAVSSKYVDLNYWYEK